MKAYYEGGIPNIISDEGRQGFCILHAARRQTRVPPYFSLNIKLTLSMLHFMIEILSASFD